MLIDSAVRATNGNLSNRDAVRAALRKADFVSLRGRFRFANNHYPIQDFYTVRAAKRADGKFQTEIVERIFENYTDVYAAQCQMRW